MTPNIAVHSSQDTNLARKAAVSFARNQPHESPEKIVNELLERLKKVKRRRKLKGLNHWEEFAPRHLERIARRQDAKGLREIAVFMATRDDEALRFAYRITQDWSLAQSALDQTYNELLAGRTWVKVVFHALKLNARNVLDLRMTERRRFRSLDTVPARSVADRYGVSEESSDELELQDFTSHRRDDQDPLEILLAREEPGEVNDELEYAVRNVRCRGNRSILKAKWWMGSGLAELERHLRGSDLGGSPE